MKLCGCQDTCPMRLYSKFQLPGWSGTLQAGQRLIFKNLPCKSPRFLAFFQRLCFYGYLEAFSGKVQESRPCLTFNFTYWDMFFDLKKASGGCQEASESWHVLNFLSFWLHQTTQTQCLTTIRLLRAWKLFNNEYISYKKSWMVSWGHGPGVRWEQGHGGVHQDHGKHDQIHVLHLFQNASIQGCQMCHIENQEQVDSDNKDVEESIRMSVCHLLKNVCIKGCHICHKGDIEKVDSNRQYLQAQNLLKLNNLLNKKL